jgi:Domain of unknown function (DUF1851)
VEAGGDAQGWRVILGWGERVSNREGLRAVEPALVASVSLADVEEALRDWRSLYPDLGRPILMSAVGDVFLEDAKGQVSRLDTGGDSLSFIAESREVFEAEAPRAANLEEWFLEPVVMDLRNKGMLLKENQCYGFTILPIFKEGSYRAENRFVLNAMEHLRFTADMILQTRSLKDGESVVLRVV